MKMKIKRILRRFVYWQCSKLGLVPYRFLVASKRGGSIDHRGVILADASGLAAMKATFRVGFDNVAQSWLIDERG